MEMSRQKILLVDNKPTYCDTVREFLERHGYLVLVAYDAATAKTLIEREALSLIVIDIRLVNEEDEQDESGLTLARQIDPNIPKIILTAYPTYNAVREALGPSIDGLPPAVGFVAKQEGLPKLLTTIRLALLQLHPTFKTQLLRELQAPELWAVGERLEALGAGTFIHRLQTATAAATEQLTKMLNDANRRAAHHHKFGLIARVIGIALIVVAIMLLLGGATESGAVSLVFSLLTDFINTVFSKQEDKAHQLARHLYEELQEVEHDRHLLLLCEALESPQDRDEYRKKVIDHILLRQSHSLHESGSHLAAAAGK